MAKGFDDLKFSKHCAAGFDRRAEMPFDNGYGVSVICGEYAHADPGQYELAVLKDGALHYENAVAQGDVRGHLSQSEVTDLMAEVQAFGP